MLYAALLFVYILCVCMQRRCSPIKWCFVFILKENYEFYARRADLRERMRLKMRALRFAPLDDPFRRLVFKLTRTHLHERRHAHVHTHAHLRISTQIHHAHAHAHAHAHKQGAHAQRTRTHSPSSGVN